MGEVSKRRNLYDAGLGGKMIGQTREGV